jgi:hypothetical protein
MQAAGKRRSKATADRRSILGIRGRGFRRSDGRIMLIHREELAPGDEGTVAIEPLFPES